MYTGSMIVLLHVIIALSSIVIAAYSYLRPSRKSLSMNYGLIAATIGTGFYLVVNEPAHMIEACLMGVAYLAIVSATTVMARVKLARTDSNFVHTK